MKNSGSKLFDMKRILIIIMFSFLGLTKSQCQTYDDFAQWYINSDLVIIGKATKDDKILLQKVDTINLSNHQVKYDLIKHKYEIKIDSVLKGKYNLDTITITSVPEKDNYNEYQETKLESGLVRVSGYSGPNYNGNYAQIQLYNQIVFLKKTDSAFGLVHRLDVTKEIMTLLKGVDQYGMSNINPMIENDK